MAEQSFKVPGVDHPITIERNERPVTVRFGGKVIASTTRALRLREANYPPVQYIPRDDIEMGYLKASKHRTHCPYKGDASYFDVSVGDRQVQNIAWSYETPYDAVAAIKDHLAFYPDRVDSIDEAA